MSQDYKDLPTLEELKQTQKAWLSSAMKSGEIRDCCLVTCHVGKPFDVPLRHSWKAWEFRRDNLILTYYNWTGSYKDQHFQDCELLIVMGDTGQFARVKMIDGKADPNSHFVPGEWQSIIRNFSEAARKKERERQANMDLEARIELAKKLLII